MTVGETIEVDLAQGKVFEFTFRARKGQEVTFETTSDSTVVDPLLVLLNSDGEPLLASDDIDEEGENYDGRITFTAVTPGAYTLILSHSGSGSEGTVELTVK
ncbi:MAG: PPC domain-containing protein [Anaerolineae bacterium]|nr:PPC domain-containing protein [Anaerolineae bacterium]